MVDETSEQKRLKDGVARPIVDSVGSLIQDFERVVGQPDD
jgi:hypothetical protein